MKWEASMQTEVNIVGIKGVNMIKIYFMKPLNNQ